VAACAIAVLSICTYASAQTETILYNFANDVNPLGPLVSDAAGNLYGAANNGDVFELMAQSGGSWTETVLYNLSSENFNYSSGGLIFDAQGNLYGASLYGGSEMKGSVFELMPQSDGSWAEKILWSFDGTNGENPGGELVFDASGNLYGTAYLGGAYGYGVTYELTPQKGPHWSETVLHSFGSGTDGQNAFSGVVLDAEGNVYGTAGNGGTYGGGIAYELAHTSWDETILHNFGSATDAAGLYTNMIFDSAGNLYGTTAGGGNYGFGAAFELTPQKNGGWAEKVLHSFGNGTDGSEPSSGLIFDSAGNLYGATFEGGIYQQACQSYFAGTVFELKLTKSGKWGETTLDSFCYSDPGGGGVQGVIFGKSGNLYGTTYAGSTYGGGAAFEIKP
jgi:hypothetical protein